MEQIETQASDLRFLAQAPVALSDSASVSYGTPQAPSLASPPATTAFGDNPPPTESNKRKSLAHGPSSTGPKQTRSKRNRYISIACNECKRRKIKCNGETPCQRCGNLNLACLYAPNCCSNSFRDSEEFKRVASQLGRLQEDVNWLHQTLRSLQTDGSRPPPHDRNGPATGNSTSFPASTSTAPWRSTSLHPLDASPKAKVAAFRGPTSMDFSLDVANTTIANMGYHGLQESDDVDQPSSGTPMHPNEASREPLSEFDKDEMVRLCRFHEDEIGLMYPVLSIQSVITHAKALASTLEAARHREQPLEAINDEKTLQLKMVMCCALVVEQHGQTDKATRLYDSMEAIVNRKLMADPSEAKNIPLLCLLAGYRFLSNEEVLAWRVIGQVARLCLELGIHQKKGLMKIADESERKDALNGFWSAYVLDRRWAFGTGLPFAVQDDEIDPDLPFPDEYPFLVAMITYSRIGAKVWRQVSHFGPVLAHEVRQEDIENLDGEILQWYEGVPEEIKVRSWGRELAITSTPSYNLQRLRIWTYLRLNQIRIWLYTPILHSATAILSNPELAGRVVDLAKDTIQYLNHLNSTTNLYRRAQVFYHQFLMSAIAVIFLASVHAPVRFSALCREEFYLALELVKDLSAKSLVSKRLWRTIRSLKNVAPRFGLNSDEVSGAPGGMGAVGPPEDLVAGGAVGRASFGPSVAMATPQAAQHGLALPQQQEQLPEAPGPETPLGLNGKRLQSELSKIFEGYAGMNGFAYGNSEAEASRSALASPPEAEGGLAAPMFGPDGGVFMQMRDLF